MKTIPYGRQHINKQDIAEVVKVLKSDWITQGPKIKEFESDLARYCGVKYAVCVSSGTAALHIACLTAGLKKGDEAITTPITFLATANSILYSGAKPVFADIDYDSANINPDEISKKISKNTKAVLPVHFAGLPCDMPEIAKIARKNKLVVIEDAAHALGAEYKYKGKWHKIGSCKHSDMTVFSFHPVKHVTSGEGGCVTTNNKRYYDKLKMLRSHGIIKNKDIAKSKGPWYYEMRELGFNYRITDFQSALGISQLKRLNKFIKRRREIAAVYDKKLSGINGVGLPLERKYIKSAYHIYCIRIKDHKRRRYIFEKLRTSGIGVQVHYIPVYIHPYYRKLFSYKKGAYPSAQKYYREAITLPLYHGLKSKDINRVIKKLKNVLG